MIENYNDIKQQVIEILKCSQSIDNPKVDKLMEDWATNKEDIYHAFGDKLIHEIGPVDVHLDESTKKDKFEDFMRHFESEWSGAYNLEFAEFLRAQYNGFFENRVAVEWKVGDTILKPGMKLSKSFKFFWNDKDTIDHWQTEASMLVQENKISGILCMSIHPLDFLSMSENTSNWRSCHALDGEYRAGMMSYIADPATIICYLKGEDDVKLPNFPSKIKWNNKKWRLLIERSESRNFIAAGRQYPMAIDQSVLDQLKQEYANLFHIDIMSAWHNDQVEHYDYKEHNEDGGSLRYKYIPIRGALYKLNDIVKDCDCALHYNDLLKSTCSIPSFAWNKRATTTPRFVIGHPVHCISCGESLITEEGGEHMLCDDCASSQYQECCYCGGHHPIDDMVWVDSVDGYVCEYCLEDDFTYCDCCCEMYPNEDIVYDEESEGYYCDACYDDLIERRKQTLAE